MAEIQISALNVATDAGITDVLVINQDTGGGMSETRKIALTDLSEAILNSLEYSELLTVSKTVIGALNETVYKAGDSVTIGVTPLVSFNGFLTTAKTGLVLFIPLSKPVLSDDITIEGSFLVRGLNPVYSFDGATVAKVPNGVSVRVNFDSPIDWDDTRIPVAIMPYQNPIVISFN